MPKNTIRTIGLIGKKLEKEQKKKRAEIQKVIKKIQKQDAEILFDEYTAEIFFNGTSAQKAKNFHKKNSLDRKTLMEKADLIITLGGDGTLLKAARTSISKNIKILGINLGNVGFLTEIRENEIEKAFSAMKKGNYTLDSRTLLEVKLIRKSKNMFQGFALNDAVINQGPFARLLSLGVKVDDQRAIHFRADGLIVATPTGSTGHSLSAGGPVVHPHVAAMIINPLCPVLLSLRPIIVSDESEIIVKIEEKTGPKTDVRLTLDGQESLPIEHGDEVHIRRADHRIEFIRFGHRTHYQLVEEKLRWSESRLP